jgi:sulfur-oxidizing protein SoxX
VKNHKGKFLLALAAAGMVAAMPALAETKTALVKFEITDGASIQKSLTGKPGDPATGRALAINRKKGNCLACHIMPIPEQLFHGNIGPDLAGVASRYNAGELRLRLVDATVVNEDTIMPAFYRSANLHRVLKKFQGKTVLSTQEIEDILAYILTLK